MSKQTDLLNLTDAISVDGSNNVGIGTSNVGYVDANRNTLQVNGPTSSIIALAYGGTNAGYMYADSNTTQLWSEGSREFNMGTAAAGPITFKTNNTERMRIDNAGRVTTPYQPAFNVRADPTATYATAGWQKVLYSANLSQRGNSYSIATSRFTAPITGWYYFSINAVFNANSDADGAINLSVNGSSLSYGITNMQAQNGGAYNGRSASGAIFLNINDYVEVWRYSTASTTTRSAPWCGNFSGYLIG
jgi:hypothetical protein